MVSVAMRQHTFISFVCCIKITKLKILIYGKRGYAAAYIYQFCVLSHKN
jgi:hypothetical protein